MRTVHLEQFQGPLDLLLTLIEREKLDISTIALTQVTEQYLGYLNTATEEIDAEELADFLVVAAKLLVLKSRALLPMLAEGEDEDATDLERQLKIYREYYEASKTIAALLRKRRFAHGREAAVRIEPHFSPPRKLTVEHLHTAFLHVISELEPIALFKDTETIRRTISLRQKIDDIRRLLMRSNGMDFQTLLKNAKTRTEVIVTFLALLELVKQRALVVEQRSMFDAIAIHHRNDNP